MNEGIVDQIVMTAKQVNGFNAAKDYLEDFCRRHPCSIGAAEIVFGGGLIALGIKAGAIEMGTRLVGLASGPVDFRTLLVADASALLGTGTGLIGGIGIAALGGAIGIPASLLVAAGAVEGFTTGYTVADIVHDLLTPGVDWMALIGGGSLLVVGLALLLDGCRRVNGSGAIQKMVSHVRSGIIYLVKVTAAVVVTSAKELWGPNLRDISVAAPFAAACGAGGAMIGSTVAASSVTVLGSHALGTAALTMGLISAPSWPILACAAGAAAIGGGVWWAAKRLLS